MISNAVRPDDRNVLRRHGPALLVLVLLCFLVGWPKLQVGILPQDEGILLTYPGLILRGLWPLRDFAALYPPGNFYLIAAAFQALGENIAVERLLGVAYWAGMAACLYGLGCLVSRTVGVLAALVIPFAVIFYVMGAYAMVAALALALLALWLGTCSVHAASMRRQRRLAWAAGLVAGSACWFRQDAGLVAVLALGLAWSHRSTVAGLPRYLAGVALMVVPLLAFFQILGWPLVFETLVLDVMRNAPGRSLPLQLTLPLLGLLAVVAFNAMVAGVSWRQHYPAHEAFFSRAAAALSLGLLPSVMQRADNGHIAYVGAPLLGLAIVSAALLLRRQRGVLVAIPWSPASIAAMALLAAALVGISVYKNRKPTALIVSGARWVHHSDAAQAADLQRMLDLVNLTARPGDRFFVGPADLRYTNHNDSFVYHLLPQLRPASRYIEMNPGVANRDGSGLAQEIASANFLLLSSRYGDWDEPNRSMQAGSDAANSVVARQFCEQRRYGHWRLLTRCTPAVR